MSDEIRDVRPPAVIKRRSEEEIAAMMKRLEKGRAAVTDPVGRGHSHVEAYDAMIAVLCWEMGYEFDMDRDHWPAGWMLDTSAPIVPRR